MPIWAHLTTALSTLRESGVRSALTMLGVIVGVLAMISLVSLGEAAQSYVLNSFSGMGANLLQVVPGRRDARGLASLPITTARRLTREDEQAVRRRLKSLQAATGIVNGTSTVSHLDRRRDTYVVGVGEHFPTIRQIATAEGRFLRADDLDARRRLAVLGHRVAKELFGDTNPVGSMVRIGGSAFQVVGVLPQRGTTLGFDLDDQVFIPTTTAMDLYAVDGLSSILMRARDRKSVGPAMEELSDLLRRRHNNQIDFTIISQDDLLETLDRVSAMLTGVLLGIASISLLIGGIGIANIMLVSVNERTREIGVRRSVGARRRDILWHFLTEAVLISLIGGMAGLGLAALAISVLRVLRPELPVELSMSTAALALACAGVTGLLAGVAPAWRGARLNPVDALRHEA